MHATNVVAMKADPGIELCQGEVETVDEGHISVRCAAQSCAAERALSCLLEPEPGDRVLLSRAPGGNHVIAILGRAAGAGATLAIDGDLTVAAPHGRVSVAAAGGVDLATSGTLGLHGERVHVHGGEALISARSIRAVGDEFTGNVARVRLFADAVETVATRLTQTLQHSIRLIRGVDQTQAGELLASVRNLFAVRSRQAVVQARQDVKIDGERIHMG